jgi:hypothetical protein
MLPNTSSTSNKEQEESPFRKHQMKPEIVAAQRERSKIERKFAELNRKQLIPTLQQLLVSHLHAQTLILFGLTARLDEL